MPLIYIIMFLITPTAMQIRSDLINVTILQMETAMNLSSPRSIRD